MSDHDDIVVIKGQTGYIKEGIDKIEAHLAKLNGRVNKTESWIDQMKGERKIVFWALGVMATLIGGIIIEMIR